MKDLEKGIAELLKETTKFDFPFLADVETKNMILFEKKQYVEDEVRTMAVEKFPDDGKLEEIWNEAIEYADEQFKSLPDNKKLNGFYLQEIMHYYAEKLGDYVVSYN